MRSLPARERKGKALDFEWTLPERIPRQPKSASISVVQKILSELPWGRIGIGFLFMLLLVVLFRPSSTSYQNNSQLSSSNLPQKFGEGDLDIPNHQLAGEVEETSTWRNNHENKDSSEQLDEDVSTNTAKSFGGSTLHEPLSHSKSSEDDPASDSRVTDDNLDTSMDLPRGNSSDVISQDSSEDMNPRKAETDSAASGEERTSFSDSEHESEVKELPVQGKGAIGKTGYHNEGEEVQNAGWSESTKYYRGKEISSEIGDKLDSSVGTRENDTKVHGVSEAGGDNEAISGHGYGDVDLGENKGSGASDVSSSDLEPKVKDSQISDDLDGAELSKTSGASSKETLEEDRNSEQVGDVGEKSRSKAVGNGEEPEKFLTGENTNDLPESKEKQETEEEGGLRRFKDLSAYQSNSKEEEESERKSSKAETLEKEIQTTVFDSDVEEPSIKRVKKDPRRGVGDVDSETESRDNAEDDGTETEGRKTDVNLNKKKQDFFEAEVEKDAAQVDIDNGEAEPQSKSVQKETKEESLEDIWKRLIDPSKLRGKDLNWDSKTESLDEMWDKHFSKGGKGKSLDDVWTKHFSEKKRGSDNTVEGDSIAGEQERIVSESRPESEEMESGSLREESSSGTSNVETRNKRFRHSSENGRGVYSAREQRKRISRDYQS